MSAPNGFGSTKRAAPSHRDVNVDFTTGLRQRSFVSRMSYAPVKVTLVLLGSYAISVIIALSCLFATVGITSEWGAGRTSDAMMLMLVVITVVFLVSTLIVFLLLSYFIPNFAGRILATIGYGGLSFATVLLIAFMSAILLNR